MERNPVVRFGFEFFFHFQMSLLKVIRRNSFKQGLPYKLPKCFILLSIQKYSLKMQQI